MTQRRAYPSDLSDARWALIEPTLTAGRTARLARGIGIKKPTHDLREIVNALLYLNRTGCAWRYLPHDFPPHQTVHWYFSTWTNDGVFTRLGIELIGLARTQSGRTPTPSAGAIDTQSVKTSTNVPVTTQGTDVGKKIVGRKRGIITDTLGLRLGAR
jgi:transposase